MAELVVSETESENKSQLDLKCDLCRLDGETIDGVSVCVDCMECLCKTCSEIHSNNEVLKGHNTVIKDNLPLNFTSQTLNELKDMIICGTHEMRFEYFCEDHTDFICQFCTRKAHRGCNKIMKIQNVQSSPESVLNEIQEIRNWLKDETEQRKELKELESAEIKIQIKMKTAILAKIQAFLKQSCVGDENDEIGEDTEIVDSIRDDVKRVDKNGDLLRAVLFLNDTETAMVVSRRVKQSLENFSLKTSTERRTARKVQIKKISDRMKIFESVQDELVSASYCDVEGKCLNYMEHLVRGTTCIDAEVQTELYQDTNAEQLLKACVTESSDLHTKQQAALGGARTYKNVEVQTEDASATSSKVRLVSSTTEDLTASADVDTEPDYDASDQQSDSSNVVHLSKDPLRVDCGCQTTDTTQERDAKIPLSKRNVRHIGTYNASHYGKEQCNISGICVLRSGRIVLIDSINNCLKVYDELFHFKMFILLKWIPIDICVAYHECDRVAITFDSRRVETFEISEKDICFVRGFGLSMFCRGICSVSRDSIAVLVSDVDSSHDSDFPFTSSDENDIRIQIRDISNGRIISSLDTFETEVCNPSHIIQDSQSNIIIGEINQVSAFDRDGDRVWYYKSYKGSKLDNVLAMDMDPEGNIYVCSNGSNSIHQVSSLNYKNNRVIIPYVPAPWSVAYDPYQERLIVGCENSCVYVYRFI